MKTLKYITEKWTIGRGALTIGQDVCTIKDGETGLRSRCNGQDYDLVATALANYLVLAGYATRVKDITQIGTKPDLQNVIAIYKKAGVTITPTTNYRKQLHQRTGFTISVR